MKLLEAICAGLILLTSTPVWSQGNGAPTPAYGFGGDWSNSGNSDSMQAPPPVSGQSYPTAFISEERSNYLRGGVTFTSAYIDNAFAAVDGYPVSDISYSVAPSVALDETTSRLHAVLSYAPGFTFYQRTTSLDETDQNASIRLQYRLSPHLTFNLQDGLQKSSSVFNQPDLASGTVSGASQEANFSVIAPFAGLFRTAGNVGVTYQFGLNSMGGANGSFATLGYSNQAQVPGLYNSESEGGSLYYSFRFSKSHYVGASYQYQRLLSYPSGLLDETQTDAAIFFYTLVPSHWLSISVFGGPQYSDTTSPPLPPTQPLATTVKGWTPTIGASSSWQARLTTFALSYSHSISNGSGLIGAVRLDNATLALRQRFTKTLNASASGLYAQNNVLGVPLPGTYSGHSIAGTVALQQQLLHNVSLQLGYTRLHQDYTNVGALSGFPNTNREFISLSYQFERPLGR